ncbi:atp-dependent rna helicase dbp-2 [Gossypium australe]|uniref:Atp-dependent rna helicase dbp-2 n=1 Tax=Gossypium australe TaxID=47621 RepID=A0A5B6WK89_9ROSI|nr:atp-dependent rna helicase dbp-2 [Gossypium australe]
MGHLVKVFHFCKDKKDEVNMVLEDDMVANHTKLLMVDNQDGYWIDFDVTYHVAAFKGEFKNYEELQHKERRLSNNNKLIAIRYNHGYGALYLVTAFPVIIGISVVRKVLRVLGFSDDFRNRVYACVAYPRFSVALNGGLVGYFSGAKGVGQGDPLSPYLFIVVGCQLGTWVYLW